MTAVLTEAAYARMCSTTHESRRWIARYKEVGLSDPTPVAFTAQIAALQAQLAWADASILQLVQALELINRSVHEFEATHPATTSEEVQLLLQQIRQSRPGPPPASRRAPQPTKRRRVRHRRVSTTTS